MKQIVKKTVYHLQVYRILKNQIINGSLVPGEKINENKLAQEIGVSRSPVREALRMLEQDELVVAADSGLIVNPLSDSTLREIYQCRLVLESYVARLAAQRINDAELAVMEASVVKSRAAHKARQYDQVMEANTVFHDSIKKFCTNRSLLRMLDKYGALIDLTKSQIFTKFNRGEEPYLTEHEELIQAFRDHDANLAEAIMRKHIEGDYQTHYSLIYKDLPFPAPIF